MSKSEKVKKVLCTWRVQMVRGHALHPLNMARIQWEDIVAHEFWYYRATYTKILRFPISEISFPVNRPDILSGSLQTCDILRLS